MKYIKTYNESLYGENTKIKLAINYLKEKNINSKQLETDNAGGMCWWFAQDFSKYLTNKGISNKIVNMTKNKGHGNHLVVVVNNDFIDFTFNQFDNDDVPTIKKEKDYHKYYDNFKEFNTFNDFIKQWYTSENDEEWKKYIKKLKTPRIG